MGPWTAQFPVALLVEMSRLRIPAMPQVRDKVTPQTKIVTIRLRWLQSAQALGIVASQG